MNSTPFPAGPVDPVDLANPEAAFRRFNDELVQLNKDLKVAHPNTTDEKIAYVQKQINRMDLIIKKYDLEATIHNAFLLQLKDDPHPAVRKILESPDIEASNIFQVTGEHYERDSRDYFVQTRENFVRKLEELRQPPGS